jgi:hypothetical protein
MSKTIRTDELADEILRQKDSPTMAMVKLSLLAAQLEAELTDALAELAKLRDKAPTEFESDFWTVHGHAAILGLLNSTRADGWRCISIIGAASPFTCFFERPVKK